MRNLCLLLFIVLFLPGVFSIELSSLQEQAREYAQQYENGQINYLQLKVYMNFLQEKIYKEFFEREEQIESGESEEEKLLFDLFEEAQRAYASRDFERLNRVMDQLKVEFDRRGETEAIKVLNGIRQALEQGNYKRVEELGGKLEGIFREGKRHEEFEGWPQDKVEVLFGPPTSFQDRVWVENLKRDVRVPKPIPAWEKIVFDGTKIKITFNAWPHLAEYSDNIVAYYWIDFETRFKRDFKIPDIKALLPELKQRLATFYETGQGGQELADLIVQNERALNDFLEHSGGQCEETMLRFFEGPRGNYAKIQWRGTIVQSEKILLEDEEKEVIWFLDEVIDDQWHGFHTWFEVHMDEPTFEPFESDFMQFDREKVFNQSIEQNIQEFRALVSSLNQEIRFGNSARIKEKEWLINEYLNVLTEKANREEFDFSITELESLLESLFKENTVEFKKEQIKVTDFRESLFKISEKRIESHCRGESRWCGEGFSCFNSQCVSAKGGNEVCDNGIDDDSDNVVDCDDPDCTEFLDCGRVCESICNVESGCWQCNSESCERECNACDECNDANPNNPERCENVCESCWRCTNTSCGQVCDSCWSCENEYYGDGCYDECKECNACNISGKEDCGLECKSCNICYYEAGDVKCDEGQDFSYETGWCECEEKECPEGYFFDWGSCSCALGEELPPPVCEELECPEGLIPNYETCSCEEEVVCDPAVILCPPNHELNPETCECVEVPGVCDLECPEGEILNAQQCICEPEVQECTLECPVDHVLNEQSCACECVLECPEGFELNADACECVPIEEVCTLECGEGQTLNEETCECVEVELKPSPMFPSFATAFTVLGGEEEGEEQEEEIGGQEPETKEEKEEFGEGMEEKEEKEHEGFEKEMKEKEHFEEFGSCEDITCSANQYCDQKTGWCECQPGFWECDGDWQNGCESETQCKPCQSDADCARPRCDEDRFSVVTFICEQGEEWEETIAEFEFGGGCEKRTTGEKHGNVWFGGWGDKIDEIERFKQQAYLKFESNWCEEELVLSIKERIELQSSFNQQFLDWFFSEFVSSNPDEFMFQGESIYLVYEAFLQNADRTADNLRCLNRTDWPSEFVPVNLNLETANGRIRFWEELRQTNFWGPNQQIMSPYMELWFFPNKEQFKRILREEVSREGPKGPTAVEIEMMRKNSQVMQKINNISNAFGGEAKILLSINDGAKTVFRMFLQVDPDIIVRMDFPETTPQGVDATITLSYDFFYDTMRTIITDLEGSETIRPFWEEQKFRVPEFDDTLIIIGLFSKTILAIPSGQVQVEPITAAPAVIFTLMDLMSLMQMR